MEGEGGGWGGSTVSDSPLCETQFSHPLLLSGAIMETVFAWRQGKKKTRPALFRLVSAIMKKRHQAKKGGSSQRLSQHSADNNY